VSAGKAGVFSFPFCYNVPMELFVAKKGQNNLAFAILLQIGDSTACVDLLTALEAALFVRTYAPRYIFIFTIHFFLLCLSRSNHSIHSSQAPKLIQAWKSELTSKKRTKIAAIVADPSSNPELFE
jgi:coatomer subunit beta'